MDASSPQLSDGVAGSYTVNLWVRSVMGRSAIVGWREFSARETATAYFDAVPAADVSTPYDVQIIVASGAPGEFVDDMRHKHVTEGTVLRLMAEPMTAVLKRARTYQAEYGFEVCDADGRVIRRLRNAMLAKANAKLIKGFALGIPDESCIKRLAELG